MKGIRWLYMPQFDVEFALCTNEGTFNKECKRIGFPRLDFLIEGAIGTTHWGETNKGRFAIVTVSPDRKLDNQMQGLLIHEGVHVWQFACEVIREDKPGKEIEAYHIQFIAQHLLHWYGELLRERK